MKKVFLLSFFVSLLFTSLLNAQWWVRGGNLLWPYGDVVIQKDLEVNGVVTLDSNVTIYGDLAVDGAITENGVKELLAYIVWNLDSDPTVTVLKNTTGSTFTWDNLDDLGEEVIITANSGTPFKTARTTFVQNLFGIGGTVYFLSGYATTTSTYSIKGYRHDGSAVAIPDLEFYINIKIYP
jgi:hypothetical protein